MPLITRMVAASAVTSLLWRDLLGFYLVPHIANRAERRLYAFGAASTWPALEPFIAGRVDEKLVTAYWDDPLRLAASVRTGRLPRTARRCPVAR